MNTDRPVLRVLVVDDDHDDYILVRAQLAESVLDRFAPEWVGTFDGAVAMICEARHDVYLIDHNLGGRTGIDLIRELRRRGFAPPIIMLTGNSDPDVDAEALREGASDYLVKGTCDSTLLERSIRYAVERHRMIEALRASQRRLDAALRRSEHRFQALTEANVIGIMTVELGGRVCEANALLLSMIGATADEVAIGAIDFRTLAAAEYRHALELAARLALTEGSCSAFELELQRRNGTTVPVLMGIARTIEGESEGLCFVVDLSETRRRESEIIAARLEAEAASSAKDRFVATLSHELRTPLTPVLAAADLLAANDDPAVASVSEIIRRNVANEVRLIDDLLDLSRAVQGKLHVAVRPIDAHEAVRQAVTACSEMVRLKSQSLSVSLDSGRATVMADRGRLDQVLWNILSNASKFTSENGTISIHTRRVDSGSFEIAVTDTGVGIPADVLPRLFRPFEQGGASTTRRFGGLGLGLSISQAIVSLLGGTITAESDGVGHGTTIRVRLRCATVEEDRGRTTASPGRDTSPGAPSNRSVEQV